jgi:hypothetical protein
LREEVLGVRERQPLGIKDVGIPEVSDGVEIATKESQNAIGIPRENPRVQQRIAEVPRNVASKAGRQWPRKCDGDDKIETRRSERGKEL